MHTRNLISMKCDNVSQNMVEFDIFSLMTCCLGISCTLGNMYKMHLKFDREHLALACWEGCVTVLQSWVYFRNISHHFSSVPKEKDDWQPWAQKWVWPTVPYLSQTKHTVMKRKGAPLVLFLSWDVLPFCPYYGRAWPACLKNYILGGNARALGFILNKYKCEALLFAVVNLT